MNLIGYTYIGVMLAAMAILSGWMFTASKFPVAVRVAAASVVAALAVAIWINVTGLLGFAIAATPPDGSVVISIIDAKPVAMYLWVFDKSGPRGYAMPYSDSLARELLKADKDAKESGGMMVLHLKKRGTPGKDDKPGGGKSTGQAVNPLLGDDTPVEIDVIPLLPPKV